MHKRHFLAAAAGLLMTAAAVAQDANGPIKIVVPFAAGGATDAAAHHIAPKLAKELGRPVIIENKPGASGQLGSAFVRAAPADGSTYLLALDHSVVVVPLITHTAGYDAVRDFVPVGQVLRFQWTFAVPTSCPATTLGEFVELVRKNPAHGNYGVPLQGGVPDIIGAAISKRPA